MSFSRIKSFFTLSKTPIVHTLRLRGQIGDNPRSLSLRGVESALESAFDKYKKNLAAVAISVNSPGGSPVQSSLIYGRIRALSKETGIPVYCFAEDVAASGGYWLLAAGDKVYADSASIIGSIGVVTGSFGFVNLIEKIGVDRRVQTAGTNKARNDPFKPQDDDDKAKTQKILDEMHTLFKTHVATAREGKLSKEREADLFSGDIWLGKEALDLGLIDGLGDLRSVCRAEFGEDVKLVKINVGPPLPWPFGGFQTAVNSVMGAAASSASGDNTQRVTDALADSVVDVIDDRAAWARYKTH